MATIKSDVTFEVLQEINAQFMRRIDHKKSLEGGDKIERKARFEFILYLQRLAAVLGEDEDCNGKERCQNGACPPCFESTNIEMRTFLAKLKARNASDLV